MIRLCAGNPHDWLQRYRSQRPIFVCIFSFTETALIPGISAAGISPSDRLTTAIADAALLRPQPCKDSASNLPNTGPVAASNATRPTVLADSAIGTRLAPPLPKLAAGVSPALISRAVLTALSIPTLLFSTGLPQALNVPHVALPKAIAKSVSTGHAMPLQQVQALFAAGWYWGERLARQYPGHYLVLGECVVGGTTTAQAVLTALGYDVQERMSSSHLNGNHAQKQTVIKAGLSQWTTSKPLNPLAAIATVGDPMQAVAAGMALGASQKETTPSGSSKKSEGPSCGVLLAGGSQMLAVYALITAIATQLDSQLSEKDKDAVVSNIVVGTTRWVVEDTSADTIAIAQQVQAPYLASQLNFSQSPYMQLRAYERGYVKEGVGAGGCAIAAHLYRQWTNAQLRHAIEAQLRQWL